MERRLQYLDIKKTKNVSRIIKGLLDEDFQVLLTRNGKGTRIEWADITSEFLFGSTDDDDYDCSQEYSLYRVVVIDWDKTYICMARDGKEAEKKVFEKLNHDYPPITLARRAYRPFDIHDVMAMDIQYVLDDDLLVEVDG